MAIISDIYCRVCGETKMVSHSVSSYPDMCDECKEKLAADALAKHLDDCARLPITERLRKIETDIYELQHRRISFNYWNQRLG